jgi:hypothetical protein
MGGVALILVSWFTWEEKNDFCFVNQNYKSPNNQRETYVTKQPTSKYLQVFILGNLSHEGPTTSGLVGRSIDRLLCN